MTSFQIVLNKCVNIFEFLSDLLYITITIVASEIMKSSISCIDMMVVLIKYIHIYIYICIYIGKLMSIVSLSHFTYTHTYTHRYIYNNLLYIYTDR